ncbi:MAG: HIRAN domain-containing protein [Bacteroidales bacterium]
MKRSQFINNLLALGGLNLLPANVFKSYDKYYLLQFFVAGFRFYKGMELLESMNEGDLLELLREPENPHDECAIALYWNNEKIGFIPRDENALLSRLIDANALDLIAEISHLNKEVEPWENVHVAVSFLQEAYTTDEEKTKYMTVLESPRYRSFKAGQNKVIRIAIDNSNEGKTDWYEYLVENSKDDGIYDIIHSSDLKPDYEYGRETGDFILINKNGFHRMRQFRN